MSVPSKNSRSSISANVVPEVPVDTAGAKECAVCLPQTTPASEQPGTFLPRTTPEDAAPTMKRKRCDAEAFDQTSHPTSLLITHRRSEPQKMEDDPSDAGITQVRPRLNHKTLNLSDNDMPASLKALYLRLLLIQKDKNIMPRSCKETLEGKSKCIYQILDDDAYYD